MVTRIPRLLLVFASLLLIVGGFSHAAAFFSRTLAAIAQSNLLPFYGNSLKLLWLADSSTMFILAATFGLIAARPAVASRPVVMLLALIPTATALLLYAFLGSFFAGHLLLATGAAAFIAGLQFPGASAQTVASRQLPVPSHKTRDY